MSGKKESVDSGSVSVAEFCLASRCRYCRGRERKGRSLETKAASSNEGVEGAGTGGLGFVSESVLVCSAVDSVSMCVSTSLDSKTQGKGYII